MVSRLSCWPVRCPGRDIAGASNIALMAETAELCADGSLWQRQDHDAGCKFPHSSCSGLMFVGKVSPVLHAHMAAAYAPDSQQVADFGLPLASARAQIMHVQILAGRKSVGVTTGTILYAGRAATPQFLRRHTGYVEQFGVPSWLHAGFYLLMSWSWALSSP